MWWKANFLVSCRIEVSSKLPRNSSDTSAKQQVSAIATNFVVIVVLVICDQYTKSSSTNENTWLQQPTSKFILIVVEE